MSAFVNRLFRLHAGETGLVLALGILLLGNSLAMQVSSVVSVSGFLSEVGPNQILIVWIVDMLLVILAAGLQSLIVDRFDRITLMGWISLAFALAYTILRLMFAFGVPGWLTYSLLYLLTDQQWLFFPLIFWILANDIFDMAQSQRLFPVIGGLGFMGQVAGLGITAAAANLLKERNVSTAELLSLNVVIYILVYVLVVTRLRGVRIRETTHPRESVREALTEGWAFIREVPTFRFLTISMIAAGMAITIVEFRFLADSNAAFHDPASFQTFYSLYKIGLAVGGLAIQSLLTSRIINRMTLKNAFFILPVALVAGTLALIAWPGIATSTIARATTRILQNTDESARKSFQALVPEERRGRVSMFMDSYLYAIGTIIGSLVTGAVILVGIGVRSTSDYYVYIGAALLASVVATWAIARVRATYDTSMLNWRLKRRQRGASVLDKLEF
jgi:ATP/ADP translocase